MFEIVTNVMYINSWQFFRHLREISKSDHSLRHVCESVRLSAWKSPAATTGRIFKKIDILSIFRKIVELIPVSLKSDNNNRYLT